MINQLKAAIAAAATAAGVLFVCLAIIVRLPLLVALAVAVVVGGGILAAMRQPGEKADVNGPPQVSVPPERHPAQYQARQVAVIPVPSAVPGFSFIFSATVYWQPAVASVIEPERIALGEIIRRAGEFTQRHDPSQAPLVRSGLAEALADARADPKQRVYARAESVGLAITADDQRHLDERDQLRKQEELWDFRRRLELNKRKYLEEDVLKSPASAVVWWLARNDDKPEKVAEHIELLTRLVRAADNGTGTSGGHTMGYEATGYGDDSAMTTAAALRTVTEHFDAFLDSFGFPDGDARLLLTKQVANAVEGHGYATVAREMTGPYDEWPDGRGPANEDGEPGLGD